jgi:hypothetical protein
MQHHPQRHLRLPRPPFGRALRARIAAVIGMRPHLAGSEPYCRRDLGWCRVPPVRLVIVGATHIGQILADIAQRIDYDVIVVDPRTAFALDVSGWLDNSQSPSPFPSSRSRSTIGTPRSRA